MGDEIEYLERCQHRVTQDVLQMSKPRLIRESAGLIAMLKDVNEKPASRCEGPEEVSIDFQSDLVPEYEAAVFSIREYSRIRNKHEVVYSDPLITNGLTWRLKVYPNGNGAAKGHYISVFLEMLKGLTASSKYDYRIEMVNAKDPKKNVKREYASDFEVGECWGYNRFYRIDLLEEEGFITHDEHTLTLKYYVRAPTFT